MLGDSLLDTFVFPAAFLNRCLVLVGSTTSNVCCPALMLLDNSTGTLCLRQSIALSLRPKCGVLFVELIGQSRDVGLVFLWQFSQEVFDKLITLYAVTLFIPLCEVILVRVYARLLGETNQVLITVLAQNLLNLGFMLRAVVMLFMLRKSLFEFLGLLCHFLMLRENFIERTRCGSSNRLSGALQTFFDLLLQCWFGVNHLATLSNLQSAQSTGLCGLLRGHYLPQGSLGCFRGCGRLWGGLCSLLRQG